MAPSHGTILDSSAVIAYLASEPGAEVVEAALDSSVILAVTLGEAMTKLVRRGLDAAAAESALRNLDVECVPWTENLVWQSRELCTLAWSHRLSLADRACLTAARALGRAALTSDAVWVEAVRHLRVPIRVELFRKKRQ